jgi:hypothetical protein
VICKECKLECFDQFYKNCLICKKCRCKQTNEWRKNNKEKVAISRKKLQEKDKEKYLNNLKIIYKNNREKLLEKAKTWRENNREKTSQSVKDWKLKNSEKIKEYVRNNKEKQKIYAEKYKNKDVERFNALRRESIRRSKEKFPEKVRARKMVECAIRNGFMERPNSCSICSIECNPDGHHPDYNKPLEVVWVCRKCHFSLHGK